MNPIELGEVIASRNLELIKPDGSTSPVVVEIGKPKQFPDSSDFFTPYLINGLGGEEVWYAGGVDAIQSIQLVMGMIDAELSARAIRAGVELRWVGDDSGGLGFGEK